MNDHDQAVLDASEFSYWRDPTAADRDHAEWEADQATEERVRAGHLPRPRGCSCGRWSVDKPHDEHVQDMVDAALGFAAGGVQ